jgi:hypothetical protein
VKLVTPPSGFTYAGRYQLNASSDTSSAGYRSLDSLWPNTTPSAGKTKGYQGADEWYRTEIYFAPGFTPTANSQWNWFYELHNWPSGASFNSNLKANLSMTIDTTHSSDIAMRVMGGGTPASPADTANNFSSHWYYGPVMTTGHWYDMVWHIHWDYTSNGSMTWWLDGTQEVAFSGPTLYYMNNNNLGGAGPSQAYLQHGIYTGTTPTGNEYVYQAGTMIGPTAASIGENLP